MWQECLDKDIEILTPHWLSTKDNVEADFLTRNKLIQWEFYLRRDTFDYVLNVFQVCPTLDAFASQDTARLPRYMSWFPDQNAVAQDALLHPWDEMTYVFPPVPMLSKVLKLVREQSIEAVLICPQWPSALWWPVLVGMLVAAPSTPPLQKHSDTSEREEVASLSRPVSGSSHFGENFKISHGNLDLDTEDLDFLSNHLAVGTKNEY